MLMSDYLNERTSTTNNSLPNLESAHYLLELDCYSSHLQIGGLSLLDKHVIGEVTFKVHIDTAVPKHIANDEELLNEHMKELAAKLFKYNIEPEPEVEIFEVF